MPKQNPYNQALPAVLPSITAPGFEFRINQIARMFFQLNGTPFASLAAMQAKATWDGLIAASDVTKIVFSPLCSNTKISSGKIIGTSEDSNLTYRGIREVFGTGTSKLTGEFRGKDAASMNSLSQLFQFSQMNTGGTSTLVIYFMNNDGQFVCNADFSGVLVNNFIIGTRGTEGLNTNDVLPFEIDLQPYWDGQGGGLIPVIPTFDPRLY